MSYFNPAEDEDYDRISTNEDGSVFYGYDREDGRTDWYDENGNYDSST